MQHSRNDGDIKINVNEKSKDTTTNKHENNQEEKPATKSEVIVESQRKRHPMTYAAATTKQKTS